MSPLPEHSDQEFHLDYLFYRLYNQDMPGANALALEPCLLFYAEPWSREELK